MAGKLKPEIYQLFWSKFTDCCHQAVVLAYKRLLKNGIDYKEWEEEDISAALLAELEKVELRKAKQITISAESRLYNNAITSGLNKAQNAPRIDFQFTQWKRKEELKYFGEAKNLSHKNWVKVSGSNVDASAYRARYIETGIDRILFGKYAAIKSFLIGYIVNDSAPNNRTSLNALIKKRGLPPKIGILRKAKPICSYPECYISKNQKGSEEVALLHLFLEFDN